MSRSAVLSIASSPPLLALLTNVRSFLACALVIGATEATSGEIANHDAPATVFDTKLIPIESVAHDEQWESALADNADVYFSQACRGDICEHERLEELRATVEHVRDKPTREQIERINTAANRALQYREIEIGTWASFEDTIRARAGHCAEIAMVKIWMLRAAGFPAQDIYLTLFDAEGEGYGHAVVVVDLEAEELALDTLRPDVFDANERLSGYFPFATLGLESSFVHAESD